MLINDHIGVVFQMSILRQILQILHHKLTLSLVSFLMMKTQLSRFNRSVVPTEQQVLNENTLGAIHLQDFLILENPMLEVRSPTTLTQLLILITWLKNRKHLYGLLLFQHTCIDIFPIVIVIVRYIWTVLSAI